MRMLRVSPFDPAWQLVEEYLLDRIEVLKEEAIALGVGAAEREHAAHRIAEIRLLLSAPKEAAALGVGSSNPPGEIY